MDEVEAEALGAAAVEGGGVRQQGQVAARPPEADAPAGGGEEQAELARVAVTPIGEDLVPDTPEAGDGTYVGGLLAARRRAKDRMDD